MATEKTSKTPKADSKFFVVKTAFQVKEKFEEKVKTVNEKYVKKQIENSREFLTELKSDPIKRIDDLIDDGKDTIKKVKDTRKASMRKRLEATKKDVRDAMEKVNRETRKVYQGIEHDAKLIVDDMIDLGKKKIEEFPLKKTITKRIEAGIDAIPSKLNLPSKAEIDNLVAGIDGVNKKVDALNREFAKA